VAKLTSLSLQCVDDVERCDSLALCVLSVCDGIANDALEEGLEDTTSLLVDHCRDTFDTATASETTDSRLGYALDVVTKNLSVALGTTLSETLATFAACGSECQ
jgi:hypothetical protein